VSSRFEFGTTLLSLKLAKLLPLPVFDRHLDIRHKAASVYSLA